jgi:hypothetical protein
MSVEVTVRTTDHAGAKVAAAGASCSWTLATLGARRAAPPIVAIAVCAQIPLEASADLGGSLSAFQVNLASAHDIKLDVGHHNHLSSNAQGSEPRAAERRK